MANANNSKYNYMLEQNKKYMNYTALTFGDRKITYEEMHDRIEKYVRMLYSKGVRNGDIIGVCALNTPESVYLLYALDIIGAVVVGYSPLDNKEKIKKDIELTKPKMVISVDMCYSNFKEFEKALNFSTILYSPMESAQDMKLKIEKQGLCANVIIDGNIMMEHLKNINKDSAWLLTRLENMGYSDYSNILLASCDTKEQITVYLKSVPLTNSKVLE